MIYNCPKPPTTRSKSDPNNSSPLANDKEKRISQIQPEEITIEVHLNADQGFAKESSRGFAKKSNNKNRWWWPTLQARISITAIAIALLWLSSLAVAQYFTGVLIPTLNREMVIEQMSLAYEYIQSESDTYSLCMSTRESRCLTAYDRASDTEDSRVQSIQLSNAALLRKYTLYESKCQSTLDEVLDYLTSIQNTASLDKIRSSSSDSRCSSLDALILQEEAASNVLQVSASFQADTADIVSEMKATMVARVSYDTTYLAEKQTDASQQATDLQTRTTNEIKSRLLALEELRNQSLALYYCLERDSAQGSCESLWSKFDNITNIAASNYKQALTAYENLEDKIESIQTQLETFQSAYDSFVSSLGVRIIEWVVNPPDLNVDELIYNALVDRIYPTTTLAEFNSKLSEAEDKVRSSLSSLASQTNSSESSIVTAQKAEALIQQNATGQQVASLLELLTDYSPPTSADISRLNAAVEKYESLSSDFNSQLEYAVDGLGDFSSSSFNASTSVESIVSSEATLSALLGTVTSNDAISSYDTGDWDIFLYSNMTLDTFLDSWDSISELALAFDIVYRCFSTLQVVHRYMRISRVVTPPVDLREHNHGKPLGTGPSQTPVQKAASIALHPLTGILIVASFAWVIGSAIATLYIPFFQRYNEGCVSSDSADPGTFITVNAATLAEQYAIRDGATVAAAAIDNLNIYSSELCSEHLVASQSVLVNQSEAQVDLQTQAATVAEYLDIFAECLDVDSELVPEQLRSLLEDTTCQLETGMMISSWAIRVDGIYNCSVLEPCDFDCTKPNDELLAYWTWQGGCAGEGTVHHAIVVFFVAGVLYTFFNVARLLAIRGICMIYWRSLTAKEHVAYIADVSASAIDPRMVQSTLQKSLRRYPLKGLLCILLAIMIVGACFGLAIYLSNLLTKSSS